MLESDVLKGEKAHRVLFRTADGEETLYAVALFRGAQKETAVAFLAADDRLWPGVLKLQTALRL